MKESRQDFSPKDFMTRLLLRHLRGCVSGRCLVACDSWSNMIHADLGHAILLLVTKVTVAARLAYGHSICPSYVSPRKSCYAFIVMWVVSAWVCYTKQNRAEQSNRACMLFLFLSIWGMCDLEAAWEWVILVFRRCWGPYKELDGFRRDDEVLTLKR